MIRAREAYAWSAARAASIFYGVSMVWAATRFFYIQGEEYSEFEQPEPISVQPSLNSLAVFHYIVDIRLNLTSRCD